MNRRATSSALVVAGVLLLTAGPAQAMDGVGTMVVAPSSVAAGSGGNTLTFTYTADPAGMTNGEVDLTVPTGWTTPSTTNGDAGCTTSSTGTVSISTPGGNAGVITVTGVTLAGSGTMTITYGDSGGPCASTGVTAPTAAGSSTFTAQEKSTFGGTLTPLATSPTVTVAPAALNSFVVTAPGGGAIGIQTAGQSFDIKVTAQDQYGNTDTNFIGTVTVSSNRTCSAGCGTSEAFISGVLPSHALTLTQAGSGATISVTRSGGSESGTSNAFTVSPGVADHLTLGGSTADLPAGNTRTLTAEIDDAFGNRVDSTASVTFAQVGGTGTVGGLGSVSASGGIAAKDVTGVKAGTVTIQASSTGLAPSTIGFTVAPGAANHLVLTGSTANLVSGSSRTLTVELKDAFENTADSTASVTFAKTGGVGTVTGLGSSSASGGTASKQVVGDKWGGITIRASSSGVTSDTIAFQVVPGAAKKLVFTMRATKLKVGESALLAVEIRDANGNRVPDPVRRVTFAKASGAGRVLGLGKVRSEAGVAWALISGLKTGSIKLKATVPGLVQATVKIKIVK